MGGKYGKQKRQQEDRDTKAALSHIEAPARWVPDPGVAIEESTETVHGPDWLISQRVVRYVGSHTVVEFAVTYSVRTGDSVWREILCIDTCHHVSVHRHHDGDHSTHEAIEFISDQDVIQNQYWEAVGEAYDLAYGEG